MSYKLLNRSLATIILLILSNVAMTQGGIYNNGANIVITSGTDVYIDGNNSGDYITASNGELDVQSGGEFILEGDWLNNNGSDNSITNTGTTGWVRFEGNTGAAQDVGGSAATTFPYLEFNNSNGITLSENAITAGRLELTDGVVTTGTNRLEMTSTTTTDLITYGSGAFVFGNLRRYIASNTSTYELPVGDGTAATDYYRASFINNNSTGTNYLDVSVAAIVEGGNNIDSRVSTTDSGTDYTAVTGEAAIWTLSPDATTAANYGMRLYTANIAGLVDDKFGIVKRADGSTDYADWDAFDGSTTFPVAGSPGRTVAGGYAEKTGFTSFSKLAVATSDDPLPIELLAFEATCTDDGVLVEWETGSEVNNEYFIVEKSHDGTSFIEVCKLDGAENSSESIFYECVDQSENFGKFFYRLKQVDFDGKYSYSKLITVNCDDRLGDKAINIYPNPVASHELIYLEMIGIDADEVKMEIYDIIGKLVYAESIPVNNTEYYVSFVNPSSQIASGTYMVSCEANGKIFNQKLVVK